MAAYQTIVDLIRASANAVNPTGFFVHGRRSDGSLAYDEAFPQIHLYPFRTKPQDENRNLVFGDMIMAFFEQDSPESSNEEREEKISEMDILSDSFMDNLDLSQLEITGIDKEPLYRLQAGTLSGYAVVFRIKVFNSPC